VLTTGKYGWRLAEVTEQAGTAYAVLYDVHVFL